MPVKGGYMSEKQKEQLREAYRTRRTYVITQEHRDAVRDGQQRKWAIIRKALEEYYINHPEEKETK